MSAAQKNPNVFRLKVEKIHFDAPSLRSVFEVSSVKILMLIDVDHLMPPPSPSELSSMARALQQNDSLRNVCLADIADGFIIAILGGLLDHPSLQRITLGRWKVQVQDFIPVAQTLEKCLESNPPHLKTLRFFASQFSLETLQPVIHGLLLNSNIQESSRWTAVNL
jgi:hypothetical protein